MTREIRYSYTCDKCGASHIDPTNINLGSIYIDGECAYLTMRPIVDMVERDERADGHICRDCLNDIINNLHGKIL